MSFMYPRVVSIRRQNSAATATVGAIKFGGDQPADEAVIATGIPASIQYDRMGNAPNANLPSDSKRSTWKIIIPLASCAKGTVHKNDIVVDDEGLRYQVIAPYWNSLGFSLRAELMAV
jgi:hypothetical protein